MIAGGKNPGFFVWILGESRKNTDKDSFFGQIRVFLF